MKEILTKFRAEITIIVIENRETYYFIIFCKCKEVPLSLFSYQMLASTLTRDEWSSYYKVYGTFAYPSRNSVAHFILERESLLKNEKFY